MEHNHTMFDVDLAAAQALVDCMAEKHEGFIYNDDLLSAGGLPIGREGQCIKITVEWFTAPESPTPSDPCQNTAGAGKTL